MQSCRTGLRSPGGLSSMPSELGFYNLPIFLQLFKKPQKSMLLSVSSVTEEVSRKS